MSNFMISLMQVVVIIYVIDITILTAHTAIKCIGKMVLGVGSLAMRLIHFVTK